MVSVIMPSMRHVSLPDGRRSAKRDASSLFFRMVMSVVRVVVKRGDGVSVGALERASVAPVGDRVGCFIKGRWKYKKIPSARGVEKSQIFIAKPVALMERNVMCAFLQQESCHSFPDYTHNSSVST